MDTNRISLYFPILTRVVMTPLLWVSCYILHEVIGMREDAFFALSFWHSVPFQMEHVLGGIAVYLGFSLLLAHLIRASE